VTKEIITPEGFPVPAASLSWAVKANGLVFCTGVVGFDPATDEMVSGSITDEAHQVMRNLDAILQAAGSGLTNLLHVTVYLTNMESYAEFNRAYAEHVGDARPARSALAAVGLPRGARIEVGCIALAA
jgi:2-iminobutanoate/2-iminopropanoate deaminase